MDWTEYQHAGLLRLALMLREQAPELAVADAWLRQCGRPPEDPVRREVQAIGRHLAATIHDVRADARRFEPYRPGVDPWRTQGQSATLRPDFAARGITERPPPEEAGS